MYFSQKGWSHLEDTIKVLILLLSIFSISLQCGWNDSLLIWSSGCQLSSSPFCWLSSCWPVLFIYLSLLASPAWHFPFNLDCTVFDRSELCCPIYVFSPLLGVLCLYSYVRPVVCVALYLLCFTTCVFIGVNTRHFNVLFNIWAETTEKICHLDL